MDPSHAPILRPSTVLQQRAADVDRSAACDQLSAHFAAGRLRADELEARLGAAVEATTLLELRRLTADLPPEAPGAASPTTLRPAWTALDVVAVLAVVGGLGFAVLAILVLGVAGAGEMAVVGFLGGSVAVAGGAGLAHLAHRSWARTQAPAAAAREAQRPRIA